jgi:putative N6-adenine-specific DNA methylase
VSESSRGRRGAASTASPSHYFAAAAPGLEAITAAELRGLGISGAPSPGGVSFSGERAELYRANLWLRTASRVLVRLGAFHAAAFAELRKKAGRLEWEKVLRPGQPVAIHATCHKSKLYHSGGVAERVAGAISDRLGQPPVLEKGSEEAESAGAQLIVVRLVSDQVTISLDSSGGLLHQRGYRLATGKAPLRETLAAGMLLASGWDRRAPLIDPFCGAGTIAIEAALLATNIAPGRARRFAFMDWPDNDAGLWQRLLQAAAQAETHAAPVIWASDRDAGAIDAARANAERAGAGALIEFTRRTISELAAPAGPGWVVTNSPYGHRLAERHDLRDLYARFGQVLRQRCAGWRVAQLSSDPRLDHATGLPFDEQRLPLLNGGLRVYLAQATVPSFDV